MDIRKAPTEREMAERLQSSRLELAPMRFELRKTAQKYRGTETWDFELEGKWADRKALFIVEYKSLSTPKAFEEAVRRCQFAARPPNRWPMVLMPYLRPAQLEQLEELGISGIDLCGNGVVVVPNAIRVFRTGQPNRFTLNAPIKNIYRKNTSMVARLLIVIPKIPTVGGLLKAVNERNPFVKGRLRTPMGLSTVSKALKGLEEDLIIDRTEGIRVIQAEKLLTQLVDNYEPPTILRRKRLKVDSISATQPQPLGQYLQGYEVPTIATGLSSVGRYAVMARGEMITLYCSRLEPVQEVIGGVETDRFPNVELIETEEEPVYFDARTESGFAWAGPVQTYLELMAGDKRDQETAKQIQEYLLRLMI